MKVTREEFSRCRTLYHQIEKQIKIFFGRPVSPSLYSYYHFLPWLRSEEPTMTVRHPFGTLGLDFKLDKRQKKAVQNRIFRKPLIFFFTDS